MANGRRNRKGELAPEDKKKVTRKGLKTLLGIFQYALPYKWPFIGGLIFLILSTGTTLTLPYFLGELVDNASPGSAVAVQLKSLKQKVSSGTPITAEELDQVNEALSVDNQQMEGYLDELKNTLESGAEITVYDIEKLENSENSQRARALENVIASSQIDRVAIGLVIILVLQALFSYLRIYLFAQVSERVMADIRLKVYNKIISLPLVFFEKRRVGELTSRLSADVTQLQDIFSFTLAEFLRQILTLVIGIVILVSLVSAKLTVFMLATFPLLIVAAMFFGRFIRKLSKKSQDELASANTVVEETFQAIQVVKAFVNEWKESGRYQTALQKVVKTALKAATYRGAFVSFIFVALFGCVILVIWRGAHMINAGEIQVGELISFMLYTAFIGGSVAGMGNLYGQIQKTIGASERIGEILQEDGELDLIPPSDDLPRLEGNIGFESVNFSYPTREDVPVLKGLSLEVKAGTKIALVGQSGAGKSTIAKLLLKFYPIQEGNIKIDHKSLDDWSLPILRRNIGIVPQEVILFGGTIRENIAYGRPGAKEDEIIDAAKKANAWNFINQFPEGLETIVGERGVKLSGGQRQRVAIARAILKDPAILILDEATSSLDAESEQLVQQALNALMDGRTTLIIAHRLSTIRQVDQIYVLENGKIIESGTHTELAEREDGAYNHLLKLQMEMG